MSPVARLRSLRHPTAADLRRIRRELSRGLRRAPAHEVLALARGLFDPSDFARRFVASELVACHPASLASLGAKDLAFFGRGLDSWVAVDVFACFLSGPAWRERQVPDSLVHRWARSKDRWWRRASLVSTVPLNCKARGGRGDSARTLEVAVRSFLAKHQDALAARVLREVRAKLETGLKNPRRRGSRGRPASALTP
jgi:hypothetical protein